MKAMMTGALMAVMLALTPMTAAPAKAADADEVVGLVLGLGALYAIGRAIENQDRSQRATSRSWDDRHRYDRYPEDRYRDDRHHNEKWQRVARSRVLPSECLRRVETRRGPVQGYGRKCLQERVWKPARLPDRCLRTVRTEGGRVRHLYGPRCMRSEGWQVADGYRDRRWN